MHSALRVPISSSFRPLALLPLLLLPLSPCQAADEPWTPLFDGKTLNGWTSASGGKPGEGWEVVDGAIHRKGKGGDLISEKEYRDFELEFDWMISKGGNGGLKYRVRQTAGGWIGAEYQVLDDQGHPNGKVPDTSAGSLYEVLAPDSKKTVKPPGEWNHSRVVARGNHLEHWLNGVKVLETEVGSPAWEAAKKDSKFARVEGFAAAGPGRLLLQDHGDEVSFRALRIRALSGEPATKDGK